MATPKPGTYTRDGITRVVSTASAAVNLTRDGWTLVKEAKPSRPTADGQKPKTAEN